MAKMYGSDLDPDKYVYNSAMDLAAFLAHHPVFTMDAYRASFPEVSTDAARQRLVRARISGKIRRLARDLYAAVPPGARPEGYRPDPFHVLSARHPDALFCGHSALELNGIAYSLWQETTAYIRGNRLTFRIGGNTYRLLAPPLALIDGQNESIGVRSFDRAGVIVSGLSPERALVEGFRLPRAFGGLPEFLSSVANLVRIREELLLDVLRAFGEKRLYATLGWFLEQHGERLGIGSPFLDELRAHQPRTPVYLARDMGSVQCAKNWNLLVPERLDRQEEHDAAEF